MIIDGKAIANQIQDEIKQKISLIKGRKPCLAVILVGDNPASQIYVNRKAKACESIGMLSIQRKFPADLTQEKLIEEVEALSANSTVDGILIQLPLPPQINSQSVIYHLAPQKDVDGLHPVNVGKLLIGDSDGFAPCTPFGIKVLLERSGIDVSGKHVVILGRSNLVGKPMAALLMQNAPGANATVTIAHSRSKNLKELCKQADIIIAAIGQPKFVTAEMVKERAVVIDVGINKTVDSIVGDVDFEQVKDKCAFITPVPGGVGPMTIAMLLRNTWTSFQKINA
jgi:methylenetetrahydrofolate dehydrogenase (NADP+)/methenyltetrahydrofolate cyclohydrolase